MQTSQGSVTGGNAGVPPVTVNVGTIPGGATVTISFRVTINSPLPAGVTQVVNQGTVSGANFPAQPTDDPRTPAINDPTVTGLPMADLVVQKFGPANSGTAAAISYTLTVTNTGPDPATGVTVTDQLPAGLIYVTSTSTQGSCAETAGTLTCSLGDMGVNQPATVHVGLVVPNPFTGPNPIVNTALVSAIEFDPNHANSASAASTVVITGPRPPTSVPVLPPWALAAGGLVLAGAAGLLAARRSRLTR